MIKMDSNIIEQGNRNPVCAKNRCVQIACLPRAGLSARFDRDACWVAGWGARFSGGTESHQLRQAGVNLFSNEYCKNHVKRRLEKRLQCDEICAGSPPKPGRRITAAGADSCHGDSGGPLICSVNDNGNKMAVLQGIVSWGFGCGKAGQPGIYGSVLYFENWIKQHSGLTYDYDTQLSPPTCTPEYFKPILVVNSHMYCKSKVQKHCLIFDGEYSYSGKVAGKAAYTKTLGSEYGSEFGDAFIKWIDQAQFNGYVIGLTYKHEEWYMYVTDLKAVRHAIDCPTGKNVRERDLRWTYKYRRSTTVRKMQKILGRRKNAPLLKIMHNKY